MQGSSGGDWGGQGPGEVPLAGPGLGWPSHSPTADPAGQSGQPGPASYSSPLQDVPWHSPLLPPSSSNQLPGPAVVPLPTPGQQVVPWQPTLTATMVQQLSHQTRLPPRDHDEDSYPSDEDADTTCYRKADHHQQPPPGPVKVRFTSGNYKGTRNLRVCEKCWRWMKKPNSGVQVILRGSSRLVHV